MKVFKNIILTIWLIGMLALYIHLFWNAIFPYDEEEHQREEFAEERAEIRAKAIKELQIEHMRETNNRQYFVTGDFILFFRWV
ncbi:hypothetical protein ELQ35_22155 [Peribacillus cavernae]|uniref:Uncharacterized protein n=1 Tax=Peribacillus cavernae TaxID=1674310 RepID=A0A3S0V728_9BACI|nr:hypothetical protein [Peribacillus cavernae]MDQ0220147.1 hypothetical protein [Peribacillus cavernae]RUQ24204.1 hypothetical protein ELQ35_22155 [Peribacillus cavernae]